MQNRPAEFRARLQEMLESHGLSSDLSAEFEDHVIPVTYEKGAVIFLRGSPADLLFWPSLLKIRSERKLEQARERESFSCDDAEAAAIEIAPRLPSEPEGTVFDQEMRGRCRASRCGDINGECEESRREALVAMMRTTDLSDGDDFPTSGAHPFGQWAGVRRSGLTEIILRAGYATAVHRGDCFVERIGGDLNGVLDPLEIAARHPASAKVHWRQA